MSRRPGAAVAGRRSGAAAALLAHARGAAVLPEEAYLGWQTPGGDAARCLAMPAALPMPDGLAVGLKTINASLGNPARGLARSQGFTLLLDPVTARPRMLMEAGYVSAMRTAAVSTVAARALARPHAATLAVLGCGTLAQAHLKLLPAALPDLTRVLLYDLVSARAERLADLVTASGGAAVVCRDAETCVRAADVVVTTTTTTEGYLPAGWLSAGALVSHVSLDDLQPDAVLGADLLVVDDWELVAADHRRLLGRMYRSGQLLAPDGTAHPQAPPVAAARMVDTRLGDVLLGAHPGRRGPADVVVVNPFGMAVLDVAVAYHVWQVAQARGLGSWLTL